MSVLEITSENFDETLKSNRVVLIDFWAPWCGPCKMLSPILDQVAEHFGDKVTIAKINVDENSEMASKLGIRSIPYLIAVENGIVSETMTGMQSKKELVDLLQNLLDKE